MKKVLSGFLVVLIIFNFIFCNSAYATDPTGPETNSSYVQPAPNSNTAFGEIIEEGTASQTQGGSQKSSLNAGSVGVSGIATVTGILARIFNVLFAIQIDLAMGLLSSSNESSPSTPGASNVFAFWFTIDRCVFNRIPLLNVNYFDTNESYQVGDVTVIANGSNLEIKKGITTVYYICRMLSIMLSLLVLIYIGIRMALSTVASDQAKYKKMLISWVESMIILFVLIYIIRFIIYFGEILTNVFYQLRVELINSPSNAGMAIFEETIRSQVWGGLFSKSGFDVTVWSLIYWCLLFLEVKFFWMYLKRFFMVGLLITVSPLITITYSIDKAGDGKAQVFSNWMSEFLLNVLIQPLHALIYLVFILTANAIATASPLVALALLFTLGTVEKMVKVIFNMNATSLTSIGALLGKKGK